MRDGAVPDGAPLPDWTALAEQSEGLGIPLASLQVRQLQDYLELLCEWNRKFNLTAIEEPQEILLKHFLDSLTCGLAVNFAAQQTLVDVGTGAGFPGLVLKIAFPHLQVVLLDSVRKRVGFLSRVIEELRLPGVVALHERAEDAAKVPPRGSHEPSGGRIRVSDDGRLELPLGPDGKPVLRELFDVVTARAVARMSVLAEWTLPFARVGGLVLAMKGPGIEPELQEAARAITLLGGGEIQSRELVLPGTDIGRSLVRVSKVRSTPREYPRPGGRARSAPL